MTDVITLTYHISPGDFTRAGEISSDVKSKLEQMGVSLEAVRRVIITTYEGEINMVIRTEGGGVTIEISPQCVRMILTDKGPGIPDMDQAMQAGWSATPDEVRSLEFGAGMGPPNIKKYTDTMKIDATLGIGTIIGMVVNL